MSQRFRNKVSQEGYVPPRGIVARQESFDTSPQDRAPLMGGTSDQMAAASPSMPGAFEIQHVMAQASDATYPSLQPSIKDQINYEIGGQRGQVDGVPYSLGVVSSDQVENFALTGEQANIRRQFNQQSIGPVGTSDHNAILAAAFAQSINQYYPGEEAQADVIRAL